jgi:hypothetical protein
MRIWAANFASHRQTMRIRNFCEKRQVAITCNHLQLAAIDTPKLQLHTSKE